MTKAPAHTLLIPKAPNHNRIKDSQARPANAAEKRHHNRIAAMGCLVCGARACVHHERGKPVGKRDHRYVAPLCPCDHQTGKNARHVIGFDKFNELLGFNLREWAEREWAVSQRLETEK